MKDLLEFKGFKGSIEASVEDGLLFGKVLFIDGLIAYSGENIQEIRNAFEESIDEYLAECVVNGVEPQKPYSGSLNIRIGEELHRKASVLAYKKSISLNEFIRSSIVTAVDDTPHDYAIRLSDAISSMQRIVSRVSYSMEHHSYSSEEERDVIRNQQYYSENETQNSVLAH